MFFLFISFIFSLKPIYLIAGFGNSPIYSEISQISLYPECPRDIHRILIKDESKYNIDFLKRYPDCVAKLFQVKFNNTSGKVEQLPGITTYSSSIDDPSIFFNTYGAIISKIKQLDYQDKINLFSVGYNHFLHPVTSYPIYDKLKNHIEHKYNQTGEKSIFISIEQGCSFTSIFLSNYSQAKWIQRYIDSTIFISPTFAGFPSLSTLFSQSIPPFISNDEFKKSLMRMPGLHISLPNYAVYQNFTLDSNNNVTRSFEFLKEFRKVDDESEKIFRASVEKYLKVPIPEPPIPSLIISNEKTVKTTTNSIISIKDDSMLDESIAISVEYACTHWKSAQCTKSNEPSQFIFQYINGLSSERTIIPKEEEADNESYVPITTILGNYANSAYVTSHTVDASMFTYSVPEARTNMPITNIFDSNAKTYYVSNYANNETYHNTIEINFTEPITLEAFLYDSVYSTSGDSRTFFGFPTVLYAYTSLGKDTPYKLAAIFYGSPIYPWTRIQFAFREFVRCDRLKLEFVNVTEQNLAGEPDNSIVIGGLVFIRKLYISSESYFNNVAFLREHAIDRSKYSYSASEGLADYPISNAFDDDPSTYYIASNSNSDSFQNFIEIVFNEKVILDSFLYDVVKKTVDNSTVLQGYPTQIKVYASTNNDQYVLKQHIYGPGNPEWNRTCFQFAEPIECDKLKIEFTEVMEQTMNGNSNSPVIAGLQIVRYLNQTNYNNSNFIYTNTYLNEYAINPSKFTYSGDESMPGFPLSNAFNGINYNYYISSQVTNDTFNNIISINFTETVLLQDILMDLAYKSSSVRNYQGYPKMIHIYKSTGNEPFSLCNIFVGTPISPTSRIQLHFKEPIQVDKLKLEFVDVAEQTSVSVVNTKKLMLSTIYFLPVHEVNSKIIPIDCACEKYLNNTYVNSIMVDKSKFTYTIDPGMSQYEDSHIFDNDPTTVYVSSVESTLTYHTPLEITFNETVTLEAFLYDSFYVTTSPLRSFKGFPTGLKVYTSINDEPYSLVALFVGEPVYPWDRIQFVFDDFVQFDKMKIEFYDVSQQSEYKTAPSCTVIIKELYFLHAQIPSTPIPPTFTPTNSPSPSITPTDSLLPSPSFSPTNSPLSSFSPSSSASPSPSDVPPYNPTQIPISDVCDAHTHCSFEGDKDHQVLVTISTAVFDNIQSNEDGGAIHLKNAGIVCESISFIGCQTNSGGSSGGGGGIYISNEIETTNQITLNSVSFSNCKASYGGAVYIYSAFVESRVEISNCFFKSNQATSISYSSSLTGGSAMFISSKSLTIHDCSFSNNAGESQLKIQNTFKSSPSESKRSTSSANSLSKTTNEIKYCRFVIDRKTRSSLFYMTGENGVSCFIRNSVFVGDLSTGCYHINGLSRSRFSPKLIVESCKFSSTYAKAFNTNEEEEYVQVVYQKQTFDYEEKEEKKSNNNATYIGIILFVGVAILVFVIVIICKKQVDTQKMLKESHI